MLFPDLEQEPDNTITVSCGACNGEGRIYRTRYGGNDPDVIDCGPCQCCDGTGGELINGEFIEEEDCWLCP